MHNLLGPLPRRYYVLAALASLSALPFLPNAFEFAAYLAAGLTVVLSGLGAPLRSHAIHRRSAVLLTAVVLYLILQSLGILVDVENVSVKEAQFVFLLLMVCVSFTLSLRAIQKLFQVLVLGKVGGAFVTLLVSVTTAHDSVWLYSPGLTLLIAWAVCAVPHARRWRPAGLATAAMSLAAAGTVGSSGDVVVTVCVLSYVYGYRFPLVRWVLYGFPLLVVVVGAYFYVTFPKPLPEILSQTSLWTFAQRINLWSGAVKMALDNFPVGVGTGEFRRTFMSYLPKRYELSPYAFDLLKVDTPHNQIMLALAENGALAAASLVTAFSVLTRTYRAPVMKFAQTVLVAYWTLFGGDWFYGSNGLLILVALVFVVRSASGQPEERSSRADPARYQLA